MTYKSSASRAKTSVAARVEMGSQAGGQNRVMPKTHIPQEIYDKLHGEDL